MTGSHGTKDGKMNPFILRSTALTLGMADYETLFIHFILPFHLQFCARGKRKNGHLKTLRSTAFSTDPCSALHLHCTVLN